jgi:HlyD family secretion protein
VLGHRKPDATPDDTQKRRCFKRLPHDELRGTTFGLEPDMVDYARPESVVRNKKMKQAAYGVGALTAILLITVGVSRLKPAAPSVERATVWVDTVKQGPMVRQVRGTGTLVPEENRWIPATTTGRVEHIVLRSGATVSPDSVIVELSNPELEKDATEARLQMESAQAAVANRRAELESALLTQRASTAQIESQARQAQLRSEADALLEKDGLVDALTAKINRSAAADLANRTKLEQQRLTMAEEGMKSQLAVQEAEANRLRTIYRLRQEQVDRLKVRAGISGVLQAVAIELGAQVAAGANIARVADPTKLKAELRIPETQTRDLTIGLLAEVDTRNGVVAGKVSRIDAAAVNGTLTVDISLTGDLPRGARPDLTVDGTVELERLDNVVYVGRPAFGQEQSTISLFRLEPTGEAVRTQVQLGRSSVNTIEIVKGLRPGDQVVLSDMSQWDAHDRVRLN